MDDCKAVPRERPFCGGGTSSRPDEEIDEVLVTPIDERRDGPVFEIVEPPTKEREPVVGKVDYRRREVELAVKPWLDRVLCGGGDGSQMLNHQRAHVTPDHLADQPIISAPA